jgi:hypothetical protein
MWDSRVKEGLRGMEEERRDVAARCHDNLTEGVREEGAGEWSQRKRHACRAVIWAPATAKETEKGEHEGAMRTGGMGGLGGGGRQGHGKSCGREESTGGGAGSCCGSSVMAMTGPGTTSDDTSRVMTTLAVPRDGCRQGGSEQRRAAKDTNTASALKL